jgi:uncharacterized protein YndB with AHSA1/START domain
MTKKTKLTNDKPVATPTTTSIKDRELMITRMIDAPREKVYAAWTKPKLLQQWFAPKPWVVSTVKLDVRAGGSSLVTMRGPDGTEMPCRGVYLEVVPNERIVFTDAYVKAWEPSEKPFMTVIVTLEDVRGKTRYTARVLHWTVADRDTHEKMGFEKGWTQCAEQLAELVTKN